MTIIVDSPQVTANNGLILNKTTVATSYTVPSGWAAVSVGPLTVNAGVVITLPAGGRWVVL
jgi:hypothetical protein